MNQERWYNRAWSRLEPPEKCVRERFGRSSGGYDLYPPPNGGYRVLPSVYATLRDQWLQATGKYRDPRDMNVVHLRNSLKLLNESHGNTVARSTSFLGKVALHFRNDPKALELLEELCLRLQQVDVRQMYPVFSTLQLELWDKYGEKGYDDFVLTDDTKREMDDLFGLGGW